MSLVKHRGRKAYIENCSKADRLFNRGKYTEALPLLKELYPQSGGEEKIELLYKIGFCYQQRGKIEQVNKYWDEVLRSPDKKFHPQIYYYRAVQKETQAKYKEAKQYYNKIIKDFPGNQWRNPALLKMVDVLVKEGELEEGRKLCKQILENPGSKEIEGKILSRLGDINMRLLFSPLITEASIVYEIKVGDTLSAIARKFNTTVALLKRSNNLKSTRIRAGEKIKVTPGKFSLEVDISKNRLSLNYNGELFKVYEVASGTKDTPTPTGEFKVLSKIKNPTWYSPEGIIPPDSPDNMLGSRWIGFKPHYGIHEAVDPTNIGEYVSEGCIRMKKEDLEQLYEVVTIGVPVRIYSLESKVGKNG